MAQESIWDNIYSACRQSLAAGEVGPLCGCSIAYRLDITLGMRWKRTSRPSSPEPWICSLFTGSTILIHVFTFNSPPFLLWWACSLPGSFVTIAVHPLWRQPHSSLSSSLWLLPPTVWGSVIAASEDRESYGLLFLHYQWPVTGSRLNKHLAKCISILSATELIRKTADSCLRISRYPFWFNKKPSKSPQWLFRDKHTILFGRY